MTDQHEGNMIVELMRTIDESVTIPRPEVEIGGVIVNVDGLKVRVGPEVMASFRQLAARKQQAIASGEPFPSGISQGDSKEVNPRMNAIVAAAGFPGLLD